MYNKKSKIWNEESKTYSYKTKQNVTSRTWKDKIDKTYQHFIRTLQECANILAHIPRS